MLEGAVNRLRGQVRLRVESGYPERVLNLCAQRRLELRAVRWESERAFCCTLSRHDFLVLRLLSRKHRKALCGAKVLALGVAYKNDIDDCRESPAIRVLKLLREEGAEVTYFDPWVSQYKEAGQIYSSEKELTPELVQAADLVIVTAGHNNVDYAMVQKNAKAVFDTKNVMRKHNAFGDNVEVL